MYVFQILFRLTPITVKFAVNVRQYVVKTQFHHQYDLKNGLT